MRFSKPVAIPMNRGYSVGARARMRAGDGPRTRLQFYDAPSKRNVCDSRLAPVFRREDPSRRRGYMPRPREFDEPTVLEAAMRCFWHRGYEQTSMRDLATRWGSRARAFTTPSATNGRCIAG